MNELQRISALLPTELFEGSKDWREGSLPERIEWLLSMYTSSQEEVARLENQMDDRRHRAFAAGYEEGYNDGRYGSD